MAMQLWNSEDEDLPPSLWDDFNISPSNADEMWCVSGTAQLVRTFQEAALTTGSVWLPLSKDIQRAVEAFVQLVMGSPAVSNEPQILRLQGQWRVAIYFDDRGDLSTGHTLMFKKKSTSPQILQVHPLNRVALGSTVPRSVRQTLNRME